ncbi:MAG: PKD domain-containing protein [archaeon]
MEAKYRVGIGIVFFLIAIGLIGATITELKPVDGLWTGNQETSFTFTLDNSTNTTCSLIIDNMEVQNKTAEYNNSFTEVLIEGTHGWMITCLSGNASQSSEERTIHIDLTEPVTNLGQPANNANYTNITTVSFTAKDNMALQLNCTLNLNGNKQTIVVQNGTESIVSVTPQMGENSWNVTCEDSAENKNNSETRTFTMVEPEEEIIFNIVLEHSAYNPGEDALMQINAMPNSNITVEVCPNKEGFVLCKPLLKYTSENYPITVDMPYTDKADEYILEGTMTYGDVTKTTSLIFTVSNNLYIDVTGDTSIGEGEKTEIEIDVDGGIPPYTYEWSLSGGGNSSQKDQNFTYNKAGTYNNLLKLTDSVGNTKNQTVEITVRERFKLDVYVKNSNNNPITDANVEISNQDQKTDSNGKTSFLLSKATYDIFVSHTDYTFYIAEDYKLKENSTVTINLTKYDNTKPVITIVSPETGTKMAGGMLNITFKVSDDADKVTCDVYTSEKDDEWYTKRQTIEVTHTGNHNAVISGFGLQEYKFRLECIDTNNNLAISNDITVEFVGEGEQSFGINKDENLVNRLYELLDGLPQKTLEQKQVIEALDFENTLNQAIKTIERTTRDISNVEYRRDLTTEEKIAKQNELLKSIDDIYQTTPIDMTVLESKSFVKYIREEELEPIIREYTELIGHEEKDAYYEASIESQKEVTITTNVKVVEIFYFNGEKEIITLVAKELNYVNDSKTHRLIEHIPKSLLSSTDNMVILSEHKILKKDPIIQFENPKSIIYYVKDRMDVELFDKVNTVVLPETYGGSVNKITGRSIFSSELVKFDAKTSLIVLIIVLVLIYGGYSISSLGRVKMLYHLFIGDKRLHNIKMLINDAEDNIDAKNYDKAYLIYREIKLYYDKLSIPAKNEVFDLVMHVCNELDYQYAQEMISAVATEVNNGDKHRADMMYGKLRSIYKKLDDEDKKKIYSDVVKITGMVAK